jgi:hypothetical protein
VTEQHTIQHIYVRNFARGLLSAGAELFCWQPCTPLFKANNWLTSSASRVVDTDRN